MFNYYGSKSKIVQYYPAPIHDQVIEPFAGSARYALRYFEKEIIIVDKYKVIIDVWKWLQQCNPTDIMSLPILKKGDRISDTMLSKEEKDFLGLINGISCFSPRNTVSEFAAIQNARPNNRLKQIAENLHKIRHWKILHDDYSNIDNQEATWFIDAPYQNGGRTYIENKINYDQLKSWCMEREGQVIVCENGSANWLPFQPLINQKGSSQLIKKELIYTR